MILRLHKMFGIKVENNVILTHFKVFQVVIQSLNQEFESIFKNKNDHF